MARNLSSRVCITGKLVTETPLHIGGMGGNADTDLALAVDGAGRFYLPGTALAGPLQAWMRRRAGDDAAVDSLWGFQIPDNDAGHASFIIIEDAHLGNEATFEIRDGVGIDRVTGAAAAATKFDRAVLPRGTKIRFHMIWERSPDGEFADAVPLVKDMLQALTDGRIRLGASKSRGLGRVKLADLKVKTQTLNSFDGMLETLRGGFTTSGGLEQLQAVPMRFVDLPRLNVEIEWEPCGPLMVAAAQDGIVVNGLPLVSALEGGQVSPVLPGSGVKGALRAQAERIIRTCCPSLPTKGLFLEQVQVPLVTALFGAAGKAGRDETTEDDPNEPPLPGLSALTVDDCYALNTFTPQQWQNVTRAKDLDELRRNVPAAWRQAVHVAIDRWTGGAADGLLYSLLEPRGQAWEPLRLCVDLDRMADEDRAPALALLYLILRDLARGEITLGFGGSHGTGTIKIKRVTVKAEEFPADLSGYDILLDNGALSLSASIKAALQLAWKDWLAQEEQEWAKKLAAKANSGNQALEGDKP